MMAQAMFPWFWPFPETAEAPLSGDVSQWFRIFSPSITVEGKGDPELEARIVRDVATYGAQLGQISAIVLALANGKPAPPQELGKLTDIVKEIEQTKTIYRASARARAEEALDKLKADDPAGYAALIATRKVQT